jgi:hypothetical protein
MEGSGSNPDVATKKRSGTHTWVPLRFLMVLFRPPGEKEPAE